MKQDMHDNNAGNSPHKNRKPRPLRPLYHQKNEENDLQKNHQQDGYAAAEQSAQLSFFLHCLLLFVFYIFYPFIKI
jgi:hypothetical protein